MIVRLIEFRIAAISLVLVGLAGITTAQPVPTGAIDGREVFMNPGKGNCVACHPVPGTQTRVDRSRVGPDLSRIAARITERATLRAGIWDMSGTNPNTVMPPYGKHRILTDAEIDAVVLYLEKN